MLEFNNSVKSRWDDVKSRKVKAKLMMSIKAEDVEFEHKETKQFVR